MYEVLLSTGESGSLKYPADSEFGAWNTDFIQSLFLHSPHTLNHNRPVFICFWSPWAHPSSYQPQWFPRNSTSSLSHLTPEVLLPQACLFVQTDTRAPYWFLFTSKGSGKHMHSQSASTHPPFQDLIPLRPRITPRPNFYSLHIRHLESDVTGSKSHKPHHHVKPLEPSHLPYQGVPPASEPLPLSGA